ncbi:DUF6702 family protein [Dokdonia sp. Hel_I_53]|uniref:DUF6702 family protein n=1 Tax=Dokdonia sp. Hel_I_53 TaxID=1566287 RepID=UPI00119C7D9C|nr:DUF6702 family protein [Dokdonia sp. Hel_I_53]TVZ53175.1 hypothetical protein OD90_2373 [Dokdonia sp. Hel_I_53]
MKRLFILVLITPLLVAASIHKYYLSVTDVVYNEESQSVQMITRLFYDDLEDVLQERYDKTLIVDATYDQDNLDRYLKKYLSQKIVITINGEKEEAVYIGKKYEDDYVVCYLEVPNIKSVSGLQIYNTLLTDLFPDQKNMVHTEVYGKKKSFLFTREKPKGLLKF